MHPYTQKDINRFWSKVQKSEGCWEWAGMHISTGYAALTFREDGRKTTRVAHRISYELEHGPIPDGALIDHRCRNRGCVNPDHLRPVNRKQNKENVGGPQRNNTSGFLGVYFKRKTGRWGAKVHHHKKQIHVGYFATAEEAGEAAAALRNKLFTHNDIDRAA